MLWPYAYIGLETPVDKASPYAQIQLPVNLRAQYNNNAHSSEVERIVCSSITRQFQARDSPKKSRLTRKNGVFNNTSVQPCCVQLTASGASRLASLIKLFVTCSVAVRFRFT